MSINSTLLGQRAWKILRQALLWARKAGIFRKRLVLSLAELAEGLRKNRHSDDHHGPLVDGDREFSFDATPITHVKMNRPSSLQFKMPQMPCVKPRVDFEDDNDFESDDSVAVGEDCKSCYGCEQRFLNGGKEKMEEGSDEDIDLKADQFIAKFYEDLKLQRQISYLQRGECSSSNFS